MTNAMDASTSQPFESFPPSKLGEYKVIHEIAEGTFGKVKSASIHLPCYNLPFLLFVILWIIISLVLSGGSLWNRDIYQLFWQHLAAVELGDVDDVIPREQVDSLACPAAQGLFFRVQLAERPFDVRSSMFSHLGANFRFLANALYVPDHDAFFSLFASCPSSSNGNVWK